MNIKCGLCGKDIVVADDLANGQHVRCPYCGEKSIYRKPTRIELPKVIVGQPRDKEAELKGGGRTAQGGNEVPEIPAYKRNPNLYIRRSGANGADAENERRNALVDRVIARAKAEERRMLMAKLTKFASKVLALVVLAVFAAVGFKFYKSWDGGSGDSPVTDVVECIKNADAPTKAMDEGVVKSVIEESAPKKQSQAVAKERVDRNRSESYEAVKGKFVGCRVSYWGKLPKDKRPGVANGKFHLFIPMRSGVGEYYNIESTATNAITLVRLTEKPEVRKPGDEKDYVKLLTKRGGFVLSEDVAYFVTPSGSKKSYQAPTRKGETFDPAEKVFGMAYSAAQKMDTSGLLFEVSFALDENEDPQKVAVVRFEKQVPYEAFEKIATFRAKEIRRKNVPSSVKVNSPVSESEIRKILLAGIVKVKRI